MLMLDSITAHYQELTALDGVSMDIEDGRITALIGSNGSGKTTLLNAVSGLKQLKSGKIYWNGEVISGSSADKIASLGVIQVPEGRKLFPRMTVKENLQIGAYLPGPRLEAEQTRKRVYELFPRLEERENQYAGNLSGGEQQMLAIGRALMAKPKLLMLDEPSLGLAPIVTDEIFKIIKALNLQGLTALIVSQEVLQSLAISDEAYLLEHGKIVLKGHAQDILNNPKVRESYLGI